MSEPFSVDKAIKVMRDAGLKPLVPYPGAIKPWKCKCTRCGEIVTPRYNNIHQRPGKGGCKPCGDTSRGLARRTPEDAAAAVMIAAGHIPLEPYPGDCHASWRCRCDGCGNEVMASYITVKSRGRVCITCGPARRGLARRGCVHRGGV